MSFNLTIETNNAAFYRDCDDYDPALQLAQLLRNIADTLEGDVRKELSEESVLTSIGSVRDVNGNHVGEWRHDRP